MTCDSLLDIFLLFCVIFCISSVLCYFLSGLVCSVSKRKGWDLKYVKAINVTGIKLSMQIRSVNLIM